MLPVAAGALVPCYAVSSGRTTGQKALIGVNIVLVIGCLAAAAGLAYFRRSALEIVRVPIADAGTGFAETASPTEPRNFLLVGVDDSEGLDPDDPVLRGRDGTKNTDTIMIMRVDPVLHKAMILSLPRDLWVAIPPAKQPNGRINEALATGGATKLVETIETSLDIPIDHYAEVSFAGFKQIVDQLGGVPVYFPWQARDQATGLFQYDPGCVTLEGDQALAYVRSRHFEIYDEDKGYWVEDSTNDLGRIQRQQEFVRTAMQRAIDKGARNPVTLAGLVNASTDAVALDDQITIAEIIALGEEMREFDPADLQVFQPPVSGFTTGGGAAVLRLDERAAQPIFDLFRGVNPFEDPRALVRVEVLNGTGTIGQGKAVGEDLAELGFSWAQSFDDSSFDHERTIIRYATPDDLVAAVLLARYLDIDPVFEQGAMRSAEARVALVLGDEFTGFRTEPRPIEDFADVLPPEVLAAETTVAVTEDSTTDEAVESTSTTVAPTTSSIDAFLPGVPEGEECR